KTAEGAAFATFDGHRGDDYGVYIFATTDYGETWKSIRSGIPDSAGTVHVIREHLRNSNLLFAGTEFGLWVSWDRGGNWTALKNTFPTVPVDDIEIQARDNDLVLGTHGRGSRARDRCRGPEFRCRPPARSGRCSLAPSSSRRGPRKPTSRIPFRRTADCCCADARG